MHNLRERKWAVLVCWLNTFLTFFKQSDIVVIKVRSSLRTGSSFGICWDFLPKQTNMTKIAQSAGD